MVVTRDDVERRSMSSNEKKKEDGNNKGECETDCSKTWTMNMGEAGKDEQKRSRGRPRKIKISDNYSIDDFFAKAKSNDNENGCSDKEKNEVTAQHRETPDWIFGGNKVKSD